MILTESAFLELFLTNPEITRICRSINPKDTQTLLILRASGVPETTLLPVSSRILYSFVGREYLLSRVLNSEVKIERKNQLVENLRFRLSDMVGDLDSLFPKGFGLAIYRDEGNLYVTRWK